MKGIRMRFLRATDRQIQAIKNLCFNQSNLDFVYTSFERLIKYTLYRLSIGDAKEIIAALLEGN